jgi:L-alanine-DL-glutamate epimerase-like enolase superfamily enzyme
MNIKIHEFRVSFERRPFAVPLRLASGTISDITEARVDIDVNVDGNRGSGSGAIYLSDLWAWPDPSIPSADRDAAMRAYLTQTARSFAELASGAAHPLETGLRLHERSLADHSALPPLARLVSTSPLDSAIHDAVGNAIGKSAFALYDQDLPCPAADGLFPETGAIAAVRALLANGPEPTLDASLVVGKGEDLALLDEWTGRRGYRMFKLKIGGVDPREDARRTADVFDRAVGLGCQSPRLTVDANCMTPDSETVGVYLDILETERPDVYEALESIEQPTARDIAAVPFDWHPIAARKPLLLDEGLVDFDSLAVAEAQGWNGLALKTCKGHSFALLAAAWACSRGWTLSVMDLTNPGIAATHAALLAAHLPGVDWIELNAIQYTPAAHDALLPRLGALLSPQDGTHHLPVPLPTGLGSSL